MDRLLLSPVPKSAAHRYDSTQPPEVLSRRIDALAQEWSMERWLETNGSALGLTSLVLGLTVDKKWFLVTGAIFGFCFQHALQG